MRPGNRKWRHYFALYHRRLEKYRDKEVHVAEIGVFSGGSLQMWKSYFGDKYHIHGIDLDDSTHSFAADHVTTHVGDQEDCGFWARFRQTVPPLNVLIDDGGSTPNQKRGSLKDILPHLRSGGGYICEVIHREGNAFASYVAWLIDQLNAFLSPPDKINEAFQASIAFIHVYSFVVIEKRLHPLTRLAAERRRSEWRPPVVMRKGYGKIHGRGG